jgi:hypothetical protein
LAPRPGSTAAVTTRPSLVPSRASNSLMSSEAGVVDCR